MSILDLPFMQAIQHEGRSGLGEPSGLADASRDPSLKGPVPKNVAFELLLDENSKVRARIPMRVQIYPHDTTDSIVTTVKNFYGIYDGTASGVSFEDEHGTTLIARYENLKNNMTVYVRVIPIQAYGEQFYGGFPAERKRPSLGEPFQMVDGLGPVMDQPSRPSSRLARKRSTSPSNRSLRSASQHKQGSRSGIKSRGSSHAGYPDDEPGVSDSESSYTRKSRGDTFASSEISMENILQDGRRKRPKFDSSVSGIVCAHVFSSSLPPLTIPLLLRNFRSLLPLKSLSPPPPPPSLPNAARSARKAPAHLLLARPIGLIPTSKRCHPRKATVIANMGHNRVVTQCMRRRWLLTMPIACRTAIRRRERVLPVSCQHPIPQSPVASPTKTLPCS